MASYKKFVLFLFVLASMHTSCQNFYAYTEPAECMIIAKDLNFMLQISEGPKCIISTPHDKSVLSVSQNAQRILVKQIAKSPTDEIINISIPPTCKLSCFLTNGASIEINSSIKTTIAPLDLNLFNGGIVKIANATYKTYILNIYGYGAVDMTNVEAEIDPRIYINGFGTLQRNTNSFSLGGMSLKNGARVYFGNSEFSAGKRTSYLPKFEDVSFEQLAGLAEKTTSFQELPSGWSNKLPDQDDSTTSTPQATTVVPRPNSSPTTTEQPTPVAKPLSSPPQNPAPFLEQETKTPTPTPQTVPSKLKEEVLRALDASEDLKLFGMQIRNLSYQQVKAILLDDRIHYGGIPKEIFRINGITTENHPYCLDALAQRIQFSTATTEQKQELWTIFLFRKIVVVDILVDDFKRIRQLLVHTPNSLWGYVAQPSNLQSLSRSLKPWIIASIIVAGEAFGYDKGNDAVKTVFKHKAGATFAALAPVAAFVWFKVKANTEEQREYSRNMFIIKTLEECVERIFYITRTYKEFMPTDLVSFVNAFNNKDCQLKTYINNGLIDIEAFKAYHTAACDFYNELGKKASIL